MVKKAILLLTLMVLINPICAYAENAIIVGDFPIGKADLDPAIKQQLEKAVSKIAETGKVLLTGYSDSVGGIEVNQKIARARAEAIRDWLQFKKPHLTIEVESRPYDGTDNLASTRVVKIDIEPPVTYLRWKNMGLPDKTDTEVLATALTENFNEPKKEKGKDTNFKILFLAGLLIFVGVVGSLSARKKKVKPGKTVSVTASPVYKLEPEKRLIEDSNAGISRDQADWPKYKNDETVYVCPFCSDAGKPDKAGLVIGRNWKRHLERAHSAEVVKLSPENALMLFGENWISNISKAKNKLSELENEEEISNGTKA